jgi:hypothetical protein
MGVRIEIFRLVGTGLTVSKSAAHCVSLSISFFIGKDYGRVGKVVSFEKEAGECRGFRNNQKEETKIVFYIHYPVWQVSMVSKIGRLVIVSDGTRAGFDFPGDPTRK